MSEFIKFLSEHGFWIATIGVLIYTLSIYIYFQKRRNSFPSAYNIAILGFPRSGKTTLIVSIFGEFFKQTFPGLSFIPRGGETIERINSQLEQIEIGNSLGPTTEQDLFAYRADIKIKGFPFIKNFKVQIGDFPGEDSEKFVDNYGDWLHKTPYFKWAMEADAFIFNIDLAKVLVDTNGEYQAKIKKSFRAAWQLLFEYHTEGKKYVKEKPIAIVFSKADLLFIEEEFNFIRHIVEPESDKNNYFTKIHSIGFSSKLPAIKTIDTNSESYSIVERKQKEIIEKYLEIIAYMKSTTSKVSIHFVSPFVMNNGERYGIKPLLSNILPK